MLPLQAMPLARLAVIIDGNGPVKASFAQGPFYSKNVANLQLVGQNILDVLNDPYVLDALQISNL